MCVVAIQQSVSIGVKDHMVSRVGVHLDVVAGRGGYIGLLRQTSLVKSLCSLDNFVELRGDFGRGDTSTKDVSCGDWRAVEVAVGVLALYESGAFKRKASEQSYPRELENDTNIQGGSTHPLTLSTRT